MTMKFSGVIKQTALALLAMAVMVGSVTAVAPTKEAIEKWKAEGVWEQKVADWKAFKAAGGSAPEKHSVFNKQKHRENLALGIQAVDTVRVIVILVDFSDWPYDGQNLAGTPQQFDSILFTNRDIDPIHNPTGSMTDYYLETSYDQFYIRGDIFGWYRMPQTYEWYVSDDHGLTRGRDLAADAVDSAAADPGVDFSNYDHDNDENCDGVIIIHAGPGAEGVGEGMWSHKWELYPWKYIDYVWVSAYTMNPEETQVTLGDYELSPIGVFCHEYGHFLGLPDLYDIDYDPESSDGLGKWTIMASGNYLGDSKTPAHFDAWCKASVGFLDLTEVSSNVYQEMVPAVEYNPIAYKLKNSYTDDNEYWVVENRQNIGFDKYLPGSGLCIYHVDTLAAANNTDYTRYYVAMEQADGNNDLALALYNKGDAGDPWPGATHAREFHNLTTPNSHTNEIFGYPPIPPQATKIGVWRISNSDSLMYADFDIDYSRPWVVLSGDNPLVFDDFQGGNGDGIMEASETIQFYFTIKNLMRGSYNIHASLSTDNPQVTFITNDVFVEGDLFGLERNNANAPIEFTLSDTLESVIDSFFLTITTDSLGSTPGSGEFTKTSGFEVQLGAARVLIVDDDRGDDYETDYEEVLYNLRIPSKTWHKQTQGSPTGSDLSAYDIVFWHTSDSSSGTLNSNDIAAMKEYFDNGGNLLLSTISGVRDLHNLDSAFLSDYFHATYEGDGQWIAFYGVDGYPLSAGTRYKYDVRDNPFLPMPSLIPVNAGQVAFLFGGPHVPTDKICGVTYNVTHKSILLSFPIEFIYDGLTGWNDKDTLIARALEFFGGIATSVYDGQPFTQLPQSFELHQNYPNPFNPVTNISYTLRATGGLGRKPARTNLSIYNILGRWVRTLVDEVQVPGTHVVSWDGSDSFGRPVASGVYFYRLVRGDDSETKKMILVK